ncbi:hypothetical protein [Paenibacillus sp.]
MQALYAVVRKCTIRKKLYLHQEEMSGVSLNSYLISYLVILMISQIAGYASYRASIEAAYSSSKMDGVTWQGFRRKHT